MANWAAAIAAIPPHMRAAPTASTHPLPNMPLPASLLPRLGWDEYTNPQQRLYQRAFAAFPMDMPPFPTANFVGGRMLGAGGNGCAGLWLQVDSHGKVARRVVRKQVKLDPTRFFHQMCHYHIGTPPRSIPIEAYTQLVTGPVPAGPPGTGPVASSNICEMFEWGVDDVGLTWKFYLEYAPYGTVQDLIRSCRAVRPKFLPRKPGKKRRGKILEGPIALPEPFLWAVFEGLANAALQMEHPANLGTMGLPNGLAGGNEGTEVLHLDLKPTNVLFGERFPGRYECYPQIKVCDFGLGRLTWANEPNTHNPELMIVGTPGFKPPETALGNPHDPPNVPARQPTGVHRTHCTGKVTIWQIGMIMRCLIRQDTESIQFHNRIDYNTVQNWTPPAGGVPPHPAAAPINNWNPPVESAGTTIPPGTYSAAIVNLTANCLESDPVNRPTAAALLASILAVGIPAGMDTKAQPMNRPLPVNHPHAVVRLDQKKNYAVGMSAVGFP